MNCCPPELYNYKKYHGNNITTVGVLSNGKKNFLHQNPELSHENANLAATIRRRTRLWRDKRSGICVGLRIKPT